MNTELKVIDAHNRREQFLEFTQKAGLIQLKLIYQMWSEKDYIALGFERWEDYCEAPIESGGLSRSRSYMTQMALTYDTFVNQLKLPEQQVAEIGPRKLYSFIDYVNPDNVDDFIIKAKTMSMKDLRMDMKGIDPDNCEHEVQIIKRCRKCGKIINENN